MGILFLHGTTYQSSVMDIVRALGYSKKDKLLMVHADDAGLSHSENRATMQALEKGAIHSYSVMVPCPWFFEMGGFAINNPQFDNGIHLTLTCEWENYRFGPVLPIRDVPSLVDRHGHFFRNRNLLNQHASNEEVKKELQAQVEKALRFGMQPTHLDSHMYSVAARPEFLEIYRGLGKTYDLPVFFNRQLISEMGLDPEKHLLKDDFVVDRIFLGRFAEYEKGKLSEYYENVLVNLPASLNILIIHPAFDDSEMRGITKNHPNFGSAWRQIDFDYFTSETGMTKIRENNIIPVNWRQIGEMLK